MLDTLRASHVGCYGNPWIHTPNFDALAGEAVIFTRCFPESLATIPARRALHTGRRTFPFRDWKPRKGDSVRSPGWGPVSEDHETLAELLAREGFRTALITDTYNALLPPRLSVLQDPDLNRKFRPWRVAAETIKHARPMPQVPEFSELLDTIALRIQQALIGELDAKKALDRAAEEVRNLLREREYYR